MQPLCVLARFDETGCAGVRRVKQALCEQGVACDALPPHITLGIYENLPEEPLRDWCRAFSARQRRVPVRVNHLGLFGGSVCFLAPRADEALLALHRDFHARYDGHCTGAGATTALGGGLWTPHCTLFRGSMEEICRVLPAAASAFSPFTARLTGLILGRFITDARNFTQEDERAFYTFSGE